jgi:transcriptional regulator with XRE-family HTH domain
MALESDLLALRTPDEVARLLAGRVRDLRLTRNWTRATLAERAGVTVASLRRFEVTGQASLALVLRVAHALSRLAELEGVLLPPRAASLVELEARAAAPRRRRGRR